MQAKGRAKQCGRNEENAGLNHPVKTLLRKEMGVENEEIKVCKRLLSSRANHPGPGANKKISIDIPTTTWSEVSPLFQATLRIGTRRASYS